MSQSSINPLKHSQFVEFQILYTNNVTQKHKKWHDGRAKFYRFNKKLIIYNEAGSVVSIEFINSPSLLLDHKNFGNEIIVSGFIVVVEEELGRYERDISSLYNKSHGNDFDEEDEKKIPIRRIKYKNDDPIVFHNNDEKPLSLILKASGSGGFAATRRRKIGLSKNRGKLKDYPYNGKTQIIAENNEDTTLVRSISSVSAENHHEFNKPVQSIVSRFVNADRRQIRISRSTSPIFMEPIEPIEQMEPAPDPAAASAADPDPSHVTTATTEVPAQYYNPEEMQPYEARISKENEKIVIENDHQVYNKLMNQISALTNYDNNGNFYSYEQAISLLTRNPNISVISNSNETVIISVAKNHRNYNTNNQKAHEKLSSAIENELDGDDGEDEYRNNNDSRVSEKLGSKPILNHNNTYLDHSDEVPTSGGSNYLQQIPNSLKHRNPLRLRKLARKMIEQNHNFDNNLHEERQRVPFLPHNPYDMQPLTCPSAMPYHAEKPKIDVYCSSDNENVSVDLSDVDRNEETFDVRNKENFNNGHDKISNLRGDIENKQNRNLQLRKFQ
ncbi:hypothetical protein PACTADRAFT_80835 [Pachysolen tannophilus NRRL Y-2460]|uniref:5'-3' DNA helicase ZGRF1-like N-terminal domain-containing protein n=1 Tax=Pachysolen tannophilus NRRL Y-2460 TaxID=669874 RepID=A0A1E4TUM0_PACTA|nr:hypothetical protein PACTADRAFT_80835 [Pachysolen tannophilus NRRL Y-2460]